MNTSHKITPFQALACPLDGAPLQRDASTWRCAAGHCFDIASQGYANLLPVQQKRSRDPGDSKEMVAARQRFLNAGFYEPIAAATRRAALAELPATALASCLDAGCGEGYYLRQLAEFARVLKPGGQLLQVDAGPDHLRELREIIYPTLKPERVADTQAPDGFTHLATETVRYSVDIAGAQQIADLLAMTPHLYRATAEGRARAAALTALSLTVDVRLTRFGRQPGG